MRQIIRNNRGQNILGLSGVCALALTLAHCTPDIKYPACETDEHCTSKVSGNAKNEYCLQKQCQECIEDSHCGDGYTCASGRCEAKPECTADDQCAENQVCEAQKCVDVECTSNEDCADGQVCESGSCVNKGCSADQECGAGMICEDGSCVAGERETISAECRASSGEGVALQTVSFDFNTADLTVDTQSLLDQNAECIKQVPSISFTIEGHCDERGTQEYNLALGEKRANAVKDYLRNLGVDVSGIRTISKGKNEPVCYERTESCFARNRRVEFVQ